MEQIKITINGRELTGKRGETILTIALANGIEIPNLCYNKNLKVYGNSTTDFYDRVITLREFFEKFSQYLHSSFFASL